MRLVSAGDGAQQGCNLPGPNGGVSYVACVGFAPSALVAADQVYQPLQHLVAD